MTESKKITRRSLLKLGSFVGISLLATACTSNDTLPTSNSNTANNTGTPSATLSVLPETRDLIGDEALWVLQQKDFHPAYNDYLRAEIVTYAVSQGWTLDISYIAGFASGTGEAEKLAAAVQAGTPPDLILHTFSVAQLRNLDVIIPLTDVVEQVEAVYGPVAPYLKQIHFQDGEWWLVPYHQRSGGGYYRRDAFDAAGVDVQAIRKYSELAEAALEASNPDEQQFGWGMTVNRSGDGNSLVNRIKTGWGASWQDETGQFVRTNSPEMIEAMNFIKDIYTNERWAAMLPPGILAWNDTSNNEAYLGGRIGYTQNAGTVFAKAFLDKNPVADQTGYHKPCGGPVLQEFQTIGSKNWYVLKGAKNTVAAKQIILHFTADLANMDAMLAASPAYAIPAYTNLWDLSEFTQSYQTALEQRSAAMDDSGIDATIYPGPPSPAMVAIDNQAIWNDMINEILTGAVVETAINDAHERMVEIFQAFGLPGEA